MTAQEIDSWLAASFTDQHLSRGERQTLSSNVTALGPHFDRELFRSRAFAYARAVLNQADPMLVLDWLEDIVRTIRDDPKSPKRIAVAEAQFSPGEDCPHAIQRFLRQARHSVDICVFTITDDRLSDAIVETHRRKVAVRILTDDCKAHDLGSDIDRLEQAGIAVRVDRSPFHMHHKFAIADGDSLLTGSYNWTRGAARDNEENLIITNEPRLVSSFQETFERLWTKLE